MGYPCTRVYFDDAQWNPTASTHRPHYMWGLIMEFLINVKGMSLEQVMADSVTMEDAYQKMMGWQAESKNSIQRKTDNPSLSTLIDILAILTVAFFSLQ